MAQKTIQGNQVLARQIRSRRSELGLTIEEASSRAGVGTKTWCRYEAGGSIRIDKCKGICRALNWIVFPESDAETYETISVQEYKLTRPGLHFLKIHMVPEPLWHLRQAAISCPTILMKTWPSLFPCLPDLILVN